MDVDKLFVLTSSARNLKYYPLSLREAMKEGEALEFLSDHFVVETCLGEPKLFTDMTNWELLNLKSNDILDIPDRLYQGYGQSTPFHPHIYLQLSSLRSLGVSNSFLSDVMKKFTIQSTGKDALEKIYMDGKPAQYMVANTRHYSWPKGAGES